MGATGMVGTEMLRILEERAFPVSELRAYASPRSEGRKLAFNGGEITCEVLRPGCFDGLDLVIVDVNPEAMRNMPKGIASCPNCTTMIPVPALAPLHRAARIDRMVVSTYQSVSGAGQMGLDELDAQWTKLDGRAEELRHSGRQSGFLVQGEVWDKPIAGNVIPLAGSVKEQGYTSEEWKMVREARKILHDDAIRCSVTCVRVPVYVGHAVSAN